MKKKIVCLLLTLIMAFSMVSLLASCGEDTPEECTEHVDANKDGKCDNCKATVSTACKHEDANDDNKCDKCGKSMGNKPGEEVVDYPWDSAKILIQMTYCTNNEELPSGCERYLAGEDANAVEEIDSMVAERNTDAFLTTKVQATYQYWPDVAKEYGLGANIERIFTNTSSGSTKDTPDVYNCFVYDMIGTSLKGSLANLYSTKYGSGELAGANYFEFRDADYNEKEDNRGYMYEYMKSTTLSQHKMYVLASDYFIDMIRAFYIVPVNVALLEAALKSGKVSTGDYDDNGVLNIDDFYAEVKDKKWDYNKVAEYSAAIYANDSGVTGGSIEDQLGFAAAANGLSTSGMLYTTDITIINRDWDENVNDYKYSYPTDNQKLYQMCDNLTALFNKKGVFCVSSNYKTYGETPLLAIRKRFCDSKVLFGGVILLGSLEFEAYQILKAGDGFGVVPVPFYHEVEYESDENYLTSIHNVGRPGGIAKNTTKFAQCTAFLNYQSTHSTDILNFYYDYKLQYDVGDGSPGTVYMLQYIRENVRSSFDKNFEDAIGSKNESSSDRWATIIASNNYKIDIRTDYTTLSVVKDGQLKSLVKEYDQFAS